MKRILALILTLACALCFAACSEEKKEEKPKKDESSATVPVDETLSIKEEVATYLELDDQMKEMLLDSFEAIKEEISEVKTEEDKQGFAEKTHDFFEELNDAMSDYYDAFHDAYAEKIGDGSMSQEEKNAHAVFSAEWVALTGDVLDFNVDYMLHVELEGWGSVDTDDAYQAALDLINKCTQLYCGKDIV